MANDKYERSLEETPTWAVAVVVFVLLFISIIIEYLLHLIGHWLKHKNKKALYEALEKIKAELMLMGFISLLLTVLQSPIADICISESLGSTWHPCDKKSEKKASTDGKCAKKGKVPLVSAYGIHQLHIFIFVLAVFHVLYCIITWFLGQTKMRKWRAWEDETKTIEYQYSHDPERFRFARETSFGRRHLHFWSESPILLWIVCFFRQFFKSVDKVDYLALRHGFIVAHLAPGSETTFDFQKYINRSLEEDFTVVVGINPIIWFCSVLFLLTNVNGWYSYFWLPFFPLIIVLLVGTKLQMIITQMGLRIQERGDVVKGTPVVEPGDDLFWFGRPRLILFLIHFVLFQNAFQLAFFMWSWYEFKLRSCYHERIEDIVIRVSTGIIVQFICSYVTLPLYALVIQMGSTMKPTIFNDRVATALRSWHHTARKQTKHSKHSESTTPLTSQPVTPTHGMSPVHLLHNFRQADSYQDSSTTSHYEADHWEAEGSPSPRFHNQLVNSQQNSHFDPEKQELTSSESNTITTTTMQFPQGPHPIRTQHEIQIGSLSEFSFDKRARGGGK